MGLVTIEHVSRALQNGACSNGLPGVGTQICDVPQSNLIWFEENAIQPSERLAFPQLDQVPLAALTNSGFGGGDYGRYGYSERHSCGGGRRESYGSCEESCSHERYGSYERRGEYREESSYGGGYIHVDGGATGGGHDCGCHHGGGHAHAPYPPPYLPDPPRYDAPAPAPPAHSPPPHRPRPSQPPRQDYRQEPGERG
jgi:hypothetical protein